MPTLSLTATAVAACTIAFVRGSQALAPILAMPEPPEHANLLQIAQAATLELPTLMSDGQRAYARNCAACHGVEGQGGAGPTLVGSPIVGLVGALVNQILIGAEEHGMPPFARLSDQDISSISTFVRNSWGNDFGPIQPDQVAESRAYATPEE